MDLLNISVFKINSLRLKNNRDITIKSNFFFNIALA